LIPLKKWVSCVIICEGALPVERPSFFGSRGA
jgi:hypothetical protein